jgi:hypothetical protein
MGVQVISKYFNYEHSGRKAANKKCKCSGPPAAEFATRCERCLLCAETGVPHVSVANTNHLTCTAATAQQWQWREACCYARVCREHTCIYSCTSASTAEAAAASGIGCTIKPFTCI